MITTLAGAAVFLTVVVVVGVIAGELPADLRWIIPKAVIIAAFMVGIYILWGRWRGRS